MSSNRRKFLRNVTLSTGALVSGLNTFATVTVDEKDRSFKNKDNRSAA